MNPVHVTADPGKQEVRITRLFDAPRALVFKAMTSPELVPHWWGMDDNVQIDSMDVRKGGIWRYIERTEDGQELPFNGVYHVVVPDEMIVQTFEFEPLPGHHVILETIRLEDEGDKTRLNVVSVFQSVEDRDGMVQAGMQEGTEKSYARLDTVLEKLKAAEAQV